MDYCKKASINGLIISFDFHKAFDSVEWGAIEKTLLSFGFGEKFTEYVMILYNDIRSCTSNNGYWSEWFQSSRDCRQGCPYSPIQFLLIVEILSTKLKQNPDIFSYQRTEMN